MEKYDELFFKDLIDIKDNYKIKINQASPVAKPEKLNYN